VKSRATTPSKPRKPIRRFFMGVNRMTESLCPQCHKPDILGHRSDESLRTGFGYLTLGTERIRVRIRAKTKAICFACG
jgi:hypothetical protein